MRLSAKQSGQKIDLFIKYLYCFCSLIMISDGLWDVYNLLNLKNFIIGYIINAVYYYAAYFAVCIWLIYSAKSVNSIFYTNKKIRFILILPALAASILIIASFFTGSIFTISDGQYIRGPLFPIDSITKIFYLVISIILPLYYASRTEYKYLKYKYLSYILYCLPVLLGGIIQIVFAIDGMCTGITIGLLLVYNLGIYNQTYDNNEIAYAVYNGFSAVYFVDIGTSSVKALKEKEGETSPFSDKLDDYSKLVIEAIWRVVAPEDREMLAKGFDINNVRKQLQHDFTFSLIYRIDTADKSAVYHRATFIKTNNSYDQEGFLICIETVDERKIDKIVTERTREISARNERLERMNVDIILSVANIVEARDIYSGEHVNRVKYYTKLIADSLREVTDKYNLDDAAVRYISEASVVHDIGKIKIPDSILLKRGKLTDEEFEIMKTHCAIGSELLNMLPFDTEEQFIKYAQEICLCHHEKYDGKGYPNHLKGDDIPISAQIVSIADCYDALTNERPYKPAYSHDTALEMILFGKCGEFSTDLKKALIGVSDILKNTEIGK